MEKKKAQGYLTKEVQTTGTTDIIKPKKKQESFRKDIERAFGVLQQRFAVIRYPARQWHLEQLSNIIYACIILHNMIVEDERNTYVVGNFGEYDGDVDNLEVPNRSS